MSFIVSLMRGTVNCITCSNTVAVAISLSPAAEIKRLFKFSSMLKMNSKDFNTSHTNNDAYLN